MNLKYKYLGIALLLITLIIVSSVHFGVFSRGTIIVKVYNETSNAQKIWLKLDSNEEEYILEKKEKRKIKCNTKDFSAGLTMSYIDEEGALQSVVLVEYIEDYYFGTIDVKLEEQNDKMISITISKNIRI